MKNNNGNEYIKEIAEWLENVRFRKQFFGGVSEHDVWKRIEELNEKYQEALRAERIRFNALLEHYTETGIVKQEEEMVHND